MKKIILSILGVLVSLTGFSEDYGHDHTACDSRYFIGTGEVIVRSAPALSASALYKAEAGDTFYVDSNDIVEGNDGTQWLKISGTENQYVPYSALIREDNPEYIAPITAEDRVFQTPKWLLIVITVVFLLFSCWFIWIRRKQLFGNFTGKVQPNGMKKILFYNPEPYLCCLEIVMWISVAFIAAFTTIIIVGILVFGISWATNILSIVAVWLLIVGGIIGGVVLGIFVFTKNGFWIKIGSAAGSVLLFYLAINAIDWRDAFYEFGELVVTWGRDVFHVFNIFQIGLAIVSVYWKYALVVALLPLTVLLICAAGFIVFNAILEGSEKITMKRYGVANPCPHCGKPSEPAIYYSKGVPLPEDVILSPGKWGVFSVIHPVTKEKMPTRFSDGKDLLDRKCRNCHNMINSLVGAEKHVAFVGLSGSGKSALMYRLMGRLRDMKIGTEDVSRMTDASGTADKEFTKIYSECISGGKTMLLMPRQTQQRRHKSLQLLVNNPKNVLPYRVFFNDIAGEMFTASGNKVENAPFFRNTQVIVFVLDPYTMKVSDLSLSKRLREWYSAHGIDYTIAGSKSSIDEAIDRLMNMLKEAYGRETKDIHLIVNLAKSDEGYLGKTPKTSDALRAFVANDFDLGNQIARWDASFKSVTFFAASALQDARQSSADALLDDILDKLDISFKGVTEELLRKNRQEYEKKVQEREVESLKIRTGVKAPAILAAVITIAVVLITIVTILTLDTSHKIKNYRATQTSVERVFHGTEYDDAVKIMDHSLKTLKFTSRDRKRLVKQRDDIVHAKENKIEEITSTLAAIFAKNDNGISNLETSAKYKAIDNLKNISSLLEEFESIDPDNPDYLSFKEAFDKTLLKFKIKL